MGSFCIMWLQIWLNLHAWHTMMSYSGINCKHQIRQGHDWCYIRQSYLLHPKMAIFIITSNYITVVCILFCTTKFTAQRLMWYLSINLASSWQADLGNQYLCHWKPQGTAWWECDCQSHQQFTVKFVVQNKMQATVCQTVFWHFLNKAAIRWHMLSTWNMI